MGKSVKIYLLPSLLAIVLILIFPSHYKLENKFDQVVNRILNQDEVSEVNLIIKYQDQVLNSDFLKTNTRRAIELIKESKFFARNVSQAKGLLVVSLESNGEVIKSSLSQEELANDHSSQILLNLSSFSEYSRLSE